MINVIERRGEKVVLKQFYSSKKAELLVIYGRHGLGKTSLVDSHFSSKKTIFLKVTGEKGLTMQGQISLFIKKNNEIFSKKAEWGIEPIKNWQQAFRIFTRGIKSQPKSKKTVLFFDELPWLHTKNSDLLLALEYFWIQHWSKDKRIKLIISGSDGAWILDKIINNKKGLAQHISQVITLEPFNLKQTKKFLINLKKGMSANITSTKEVAEIYCVFGGILQNLSQLPKGSTASQVIEKSAFARKSFVLDEFENLLARLFDNPKIYLQILKTIAADPFGVSQESIFKKLPKVSKGIGGLTKLRALEEAGLIRSFIPIYHNKKGIFYKISDELTLFYLYWLEPIKKQLAKNSLRTNYWQNLQATSKWQKWATQAFELICHKHSNQIAEALNLPSSAVPSSWRYAPTKVEQGAQIDLLFEADDQIILCEIAYQQKPLVFDKEYAEKLKLKFAIFKKITRIKKKIVWIMIAPHGIKKSIYSQEMLKDIVKLKDLDRL